MHWHAPCVGLTSSGARLRPPFLPHIQSQFDRPCPLPPSSFPTLPRPPACTFPRSARGLRLTLTSCCPPFHPSRPALGPAPSPPPPHPDQLLQVLEEVLRRLTVERLAVSPGRQHTRERRGRPQGVVVVGGCTVDGCCGRQGRHNEHCLCNTHSSRPATAAGQQGPASTGYGPGGCITVGNLWRCRPTRSRALGAARAARRRGRPARSRGRGPARRWRR